VDLGFPKELPPFSTLSGHCLTIYYSYYIEFLLTLSFRLLCGLTISSFLPMYVLQFVLHSLMLQSFNMTIRSSSIDFFLILQYLPLKHMLYFGCSYYPKFFFTGPCIFLTISFLNIVCAFISYVVVVQVSDS
jgi:hypothetical protein